MCKLSRLSLLTLVFFGLLTSMSSWAQVLRLPSTPVTYYADGGSVNSFFDVVLSNVPPGFDVDNDLYAGYCAAFFDLTSPTGFFNSALLYDTTRTNLPGSFNGAYWDSVNYILNHKQGVADDVQSAIWFFTDNLTAGITPAAQAMINEALARGEGFIPRNGQFVAVIVDTLNNPAVQTIIIEVPTPGGPPPSLCDEKIKGSGCIVIDSKNKANFGFHAAIKNGVRSGQLNYIDPTADIRVRSKAVTNYEVIDTKTRRISFEVIINDQLGAAVITVTDNARANTPDVIQISLSTGYSAGIQMGSANKKGCKVDVKLENSKCPTPILPSIKMTKVADKTTISTNGDAVTYTYVVTNTGGQTIDNITVIDDKGTPNDKSDDFVVGTIASLAPNASVTLTATINVIPSQQSTALGATVNGTNRVVGNLYKTILPSGDIQVDYVQQNVNDNRYGTGATAATGWTRGHTFGNLTGSDKAQFRFTDSQGRVVLEFYLDYISATFSTSFPNGTVSYPSGYGTLGVKGGDGKMVLGSADSILFATTSLTENFKKSQFQMGYFVNSPTETAPLSGVSTPVGWDYNDSYTVVVSKAAFGANGFGAVSIPSVHNSPAKIGSNLVTPTKTDSCVVNVAVATGTAGTTTVSATASAQVCFGQAPPCGLLGDCTPPYPFASANPLTSIEFSESEVLRTGKVAVVTGCIPNQIQVFYNDEHALELGVRQVIVKTKSGKSAIFTTNNYPATAMTSIPGTVINPQVGSTATSGDQAGTDISGRPLYPALFVTDITGNPANPYAGDWQYGGTAIPPHAVFGTWKSAVRMVDKTRTPILVSLAVDRDPAKNNWNLGPDADPVPAGLANEGYGAEVRWDISKLGLLSGHTYRLYFMVHDGDQNKSGGDAGQACGTVAIP